MLNAEDGTFLQNHQLQKQRFSAIPFFAPLCFGCFLLNSKIDNAAGQIVYVKAFELLMNTSTDMQGVLVDVPDDFFVNTNKYAVSISLRMQSQTPYPNVDRLTYDVRTDRKLLIIDAWGSGFVKGHILGVSVSIIKSTLS